MITFVGGSKFAKGGPNPLANMDSWGSISASRFGPGGPNPLGHRSKFELSSAHEKFGV